MSVLDDICAGIQTRLAGSNLTFALVVWVAGEPGDPDSVSLSAPPAAKAEAVTALRTTADAAEAHARPTGSRQ